MKRRDTPVPSSIRNRFQEFLDAALGQLDYRDPIELMDALFRLDQLIGRLGTITEQIRQKEIEVQHAMNTLHDARAKLQLEIHRLRKKAGVGFEQANEGRIRRETPNPEVR